MKDEWKLANKNIISLKRTKTLALWKELAGFSCPEHKWVLAKRQMAKGERYWFRSTSADRLGQS